MQGEKVMILWRLEMFRKPPKGFAYNVRNHGVVKVDGNVVGRGEEHGWASSQRN